MSYPDDRTSPTRISAVSRVLAVLLALFCLTGVVIAVGWSGDMDLAKHALTVAFALFLLYVARRGRSFAWFEKLWRR